MVRQSSDVLVGWSLRVADGVRCAGGGLDASVGLRGCRREGQRPETPRRIPPAEGRDQRLTARGGAGAGCSRPAVGRTDAPARGTAGSSNTGQNRRRWASLPAAERRVPVGSPLGPRGDPTCYDAAWNAVVRMRYRNVRLPRHKGRARQGAKTIDGDGRDHEKRWNEGGRGIVTSTREANAGWTIAPRAAASTKRACQ